MAPNEPWREMQNIVEFDDTVSSDLADIRSVHQLIVESFSCIAFLVSIGLGLFFCIATFTLFFLSFRCSRGRYVEPHLHQLIFCASGLSSLTSGSP